MKAQQVLKLYGLLSNAQGYLGIGRVDLAGECLGFALSEIQEELKSPEYAAISQSFGEAVAKMQAERAEGKVVGDDAQH